MGIDRGLTSIEIVHDRYGMSNSSHLTLEKELNLPSRLRRYQWQGVNFLLNQGSGLVADEMGLSLREAAWVKGLRKISAAVHMRGWV